MPAGRLEQGAPLEFEAKHLSGDEPLQLIARWDGHAAGVAVASVSAARVG